MNNRIGIVILVIVLVALGIYVTSNKGEPLGAERVTLANLPISFTLPPGYAAFHEEGFEGAYMAFIRTGKKEATGYYRRAPLEMNIHSSVTLDPFNPERGLLGTVNDAYMEEVYALQSERELDPQWITLFGNKAIRFQGPTDTFPSSVVAYLKPEQLTGVGEELKNYAKEGFLVTIFGSTYSLGVEDDRKLFDGVIESLTVKQ